MKIYSFLKVLKILCFLSMGIFFVNFTICVLFLVEFDIMVWLTMPFIVFVFAAFSGVCFIDMFLSEKKNNCSYSKIVFLLRKSSSDISPRTQTETKAAS